MNGRHIAIAILVIVSLILAGYTYFSLEPGRSMAVSYIIAGIGFAIAAVLAATGKQPE
ncbi:MAG: hypothetical protein MRY64_16855 [Hyphomonadaceae bacterium]|nr:hypothetical protein [Hyphomonadaceae bacterium]